MVTKKMLSVLFIVAGMTLFARPVDAAPDLTGTWTGEAVCKGFDGVKFTWECCPTMEISQVDATTFRLSFPDEGYLYFGKIIADAAKPSEKGEVAFVGCPTANTLPDDSEMGRASVKTGTRSTFKGVSIFLEWADMVHTCKWNYTRTSTADPGVAACP